MNRTAVVAGATGLIGKELVNMLLNETAYSEITLIVRRSTGIKHPKLSEKIINFDQLEKVDINLSGADVFCTLGTTIKKAGSQEAFRLVDNMYPLSLGRMAKKFGARSFLVVTSMGANPLSRMFYIRVKGETEQALRGLDLPALYIFRPSLLLGEREEFRLGERITSLLFNVLSPLFIGPLRKYSPIMSLAVAKAMVLSAKRDQPGIYIYEAEQIKKIADTNQ
ncbi:NAD(P)H-binding protein [Bacillus salitolerans]|uniref:NAD(P)H-binding protein n=1 Tax=Bacillus salitolerans TaxID=1437434 RepID=A0ABW4LMG8_9BACI